MLAFKYLYSFLYGTKMKDLDLPSRRENNEQFG